MDILLYTIIIIQSIAILYLFLNKTPNKMKLVGYVNVYRQNGNMRISCIPKRTRMQAINFRPKSSILPYIKTISIYTKDIENE